MEQPTLSAEEWAVVIDLLECEQKDLPTEIHHTTMSAMKERLRQRRVVVDELLEKLKVVNAS